MMSDEYFTIKGPAQHTTIIKKSKFISNVLPVENQDEAEKYIDSLRKKYWDATHNVYAFTIGLNDETQKFSDDGEPSGTAGKPVLEVIKSKALKNVLVVVTRYFGGILLGAGGLIRAYSESAAGGLNEAGIVKKIKYDIYEVKVDYNQLGKLQWEINQKGLFISDINFSQDVLMKVCVPVNSALNFKEFIMNITSGLANMKWLNQGYM
ncbi:MAG: hypothetical protein PWR06_1522 [Thermoanaerobacteraceae bacterium]|jgi:uncharacterized YigZ family protein|uniref:YigZ family protein n=1 Tax=Biomaibacter acetigenes TaxID=2316383 RepID=A0A3G2R7H3_9FIRM|nr:YigZ family protein [Biomaibacter acetigenes]MDI3501479.1 hypothetical protein [Thermoanaerobacter sp.]MDK2878806.1 hypothetical protein [Thermoanaerobacteraceae bacterium]RKL64290.1 YigZ family protein [Thermoanaerobacteraceae bacterium SP2]AYO30767.1 YigZ family protein [Biomaibacter acetigenes]MDN5302910.1 hypothetical protein [Thermoanaerobacteraceae bacterium]